MKLYRLKKTQFLPVSIDEAWDFFSSPKNLQHITPEDLNFRIRHISGGDKMYAGQLIEYKINILPFYTVTWVTEITQVTDGQMFIDEQKFGPYAMWHHQHHFKTVENGIEMTDELNYAIPFGWIGQLANKVFVANRVSAIFEFREKMLENHFN